MKQLTHRSVFTYFLLNMHIVSECLGNDVKDNPEIYLSSPGIIRRHGYPAETHTVQTEDGYLLSMHRIPYGKKANKTPGIRKPVVFLQHGTLSSSADWIITGPDNALGFILADEGYDVWMGNARGNTYSSQHVFYKDDCDDFWNFSWDELGIYDLPAEINHVLNVTLQKNVTFIGHSLGATIAFAMISTYPEFNKKINLFIALAPAVYVTHTKTPVRFAAPFANVLGAIDTILSNGKQLSQNAMIQFFEEEACGQNKMEEMFCGNILFYVGGYDISQLNETIIPVLVTHTPAGTSTCVGVQFAQQIYSGRFCKYDYGLKMNLDIYNSTEPPLYPLENVKLPVAIMYSEKDILITPLDIDDTIAKLSNVVDKYRVLHFNHFDFLYGIDAPILVYNKILSLIKKYGNPIPHSEKSPHLRNLSPTYNTLKTPQFFWSRWVRQPLFSF